MDLLGVPFKETELGSGEFTIPSEFSELGKESRKKQRIPPDQTISEKFNDIMSSADMQQIQSKGVAQIGNVLITPRVINKANQDTKFRTNLYTKFKTSELNPGS